MSREVPIGVEVDQFHHTKKDHTRNGFLVRPSIRRRSFGVEMTTVPLRQHDLHEPRFDARRRCIELSTSVLYVMRDNHSVFGHFRTGSFRAI